jgi:hypothetical protein
MLWSIASGVVEGLWIGYGFAVLLFVFFSVANIYFACRAIQKERRQGIRTPLLKQPDVLRTVGLCLMMFNGLFLVVAVTRGSHGGDALEIISICVELLATVIFIRAILIIRQRGRAAA